MASPRYNDPKPEPRVVYDVKDSPYAVVCWEHGQVLLSQEEHDRQHKATGMQWWCPLCGKLASFDEFHYHNYFHSKAEGDT